MTKRTGTKRKKVREFTNTYDLAKVIEIDNSTSIDYPTLNSVYMKKSVHVNSQNMFCLLNHNQYSGGGWSKNNGTYFGIDNCDAYSKRCQGVYCCKYYFNDEEICHSVLSNSAVRDRECPNGHGGLIKSSSVKM